MSERKRRTRAAKWWGLGLVAAASILGGCDGLFCGILAQLSQSTELFLVSKCIDLLYENPLDQKPPLYAQEPVEPPPEPGPELATFGLAPSLDVKEFGSSVAYTAGRAVVGAPPDELPEFPSFFGGSVSVFEPSAGGGWNVTDSLRPGTAVREDRFGCGLAAVSDVVFVGAPGNDDETQDAGMVYEFAGQAGSISFVGKIPSPDVAVSAGFGHSVAVSGLTLVVGAPFEDGGAVYVLLASDRGGWDKQQRLAPASPGPTDTFGLSVAISGDVLIVGAPGASIVAGEGSEGSALVYRRTAGTWTLDAELTSPTPVVDGEFGVSVAMTDSFVVVGEPRGTSVGVRGRIGTATVFEHSAGDWTPMQTLAGTSLTDGEEFGRAVAADGTYICVGAPGFADDSADGEGIGRAYFFALGEDDLWQHTQTFEGPDSSQSATGAAVAIGAGDSDGESAASPRAVVGSPAQFLPRRGHARIYENVPVLPSAAKTSGVAAKTSGLGHLAVLGATPQPVEISLDRSMPGAFHLSFGCGDFAAQPERALDGTTVALVLDSAGAGTAYEVRASFVSGDVLVEARSGGTLVGTTIVHADRVATCLAFDREGDELRCGTRSNLHMEFETLASIPLSAADAELTPRPVVDGVPADAELGLDDALYFPGVPAAGTLEGVAEVIALLEAALAAEVSGLTEVESGDREQAEADFARARALLEEARGKAALLVPELGKRDPHEKAFSKARRKALRSLKKARKLLVKTQRKLERDGSEKSVVKRADKALRLAVKAIDRLRQLP